MVLDNQDAKYLNKRDQAFQNHRGRTRKQRNANTVRVKVSMMHEEKRQESRHLEILKSDLPELNEKKSCGMQEISKFGFPTLNAIVSHDACQRTCQHRIELSLLWLSECQREENLRHHNAHITENRTHHCRLVRCHHSSMYTSFYGQAC